MPKAVFNFAITLFLGLGVQAWAGSPESCQAFVDTQSASFEAGRSTGESPFDRAQARGNSSFIFSLRATCATATDLIARQLKLTQDCMRDCSTPAIGETRISLPELKKFCSSQCTKALSMLDGFEKGYIVAKGICKPPTVPSASDLRASRR